MLDNAATNPLLNNLARITNDYKSSRSYNVPEGMALSVWQDKYSRRKDDNSFQSWEERLRSVVHGNFLLDRTSITTEYDVEQTLDLAIKGVLAFSGRHLQHGDEQQPNKNLELFSNCSSAIFCFSEFWLLLNGSGVGADYSCYTRRINFSKYMPNIRLVLDGGKYDDGLVENGAHPDFKNSMSEFSGFLDSKKEAEHKYPADSEAVRWFKVEDSREGWVQVMSIIETATWQERHADKMFIFDFSAVREAGKPISGQQNRPASGPLPVMRAFAKVASLKGIPDMAPWKQSLFIDHYLAACVALGGVRRSARMATKYWRDPDVFEFIEIKRGGHLWSANISIIVDKEFWEQTKDPRTHASRVLQAASAAQYMDFTGEPGFINVDRMNNDKTGFENITGENYINAHAKLNLHPRTYDMMGKIISYLKKHSYTFVTNPCGEIPLSIWGGYCIIGDIALSNVETLDEAMNAAKYMPPALIRVNTMNSLYAAEVSRTNRIGVSLTGIHEFAAKHFNGINFYDMVNVRNRVSDPSRFSNYETYEYEERQIQAKRFWQFITDMRHTVENSADAYSDAAGLNHPHTYTTIKPSGTISKVLQCTEGAHLPAVDYYIRWIQVQKTIGNEPNPQLLEYEAAGYPIKDVSHAYPNYVVVGFPAKQPICDLLGDRAVTAEDTTPEEQYEWIRLLERHWFGVKDDGTPANNQVSYTLKFDPAKYTYQEYMDILQKNQSTVRCCAVMPIVDASAYAYQPEQKVTREEYENAAALIFARRIVGNYPREAYDDDALSCAGGVCSVDATINF